MYEVGYFLTRNASCYPEKIALIFRNLSLTYHQLNERVNCLANHLLAMGITKGDRVGYIFPNCIEIVEIWFATQRIGAVAVPINCRLLPGEMIEMIDFAECGVLAYHSAFRAAANQAKLENPRLRRIICCGDQICDGEYSFASLCETGNTNEPNIEVKEEDWSMILFTSGTTGVSKGVVRTQRIIRDYALMMMIENGGAHEDEIFLTHCPLFHTAGMGLLMKVMALSGTFIIMDKVDPQEVLTMIDQYKVTQIMLLPPILYARLYEVQGWEKYNLSSVREAQATGGRCSLDLVKVMFQMFPNCKIKTSYGSSETCAPTSVLMTQDEVLRNPERIKSVGRLNSLVEIKLCDPSGREVPRGETGEALVRSSMVMKEYLNHPELTEAVFSGGWFHTEDMFRQDEDGYYYLMDRRKDMIKTGGENVYAQEVEGVLNEHPAVKECAVIGVSDRCFGEAVAVAIVLNKGYTMSDQEIIVFSRKHLASYKKPRYIAFVEELPRNSVGKIQKNSLRAESAQLFRPIADIRADKQI